MWKISFQICWNFIWTHLCPSCWVLITPYPMFCNFIQSFVCTKYLLRTEREDFLNYFPGSFIIYEEDEEVEKKLQQKVISTLQVDTNSPTHPYRKTKQKKVIICIVENFYFPNSVCVVLQPEAAKILTIHFNDYDDWFSSLRVTICFPPFSESVSKINNRKK